MNGPKDDVEAATDRAWMSAGQAMYGQAEVSDSRNTPKGHSYDCYAFYCIGLVTGSIRQLRHLGSKTCLYLWCILLH